MTLTAEKKAKLTPLVSGAVRDLREAASLKVEKAANNLIWRIAG